MTQKCRHMQKPVVIVTGASRGLGRATAVALAEMKADLILAGRNQEALKQSAEQATAAGATVEVISGDITDGSHCQQLVMRAMSRFERLDAVINNAGVVTPIGPLAKTQADDWRTAIEANLIGPYLVSRAALPALRRSQGRLINVGTGASSQPIGGWSAYCSSKAGLLMMTRVLAGEEPQVTVLSFTPGVVDTGMQEKIREDAPEGMPENLAQYFLSLPASGQLEPPEVPGKALARLALAAPRSWTGHEFDYKDPRLSSLQTPV